MNSLTSINQKLGWIVSLGLVLAQTLIMLLMDAQVALIGYLSAGLFLPFWVIGIVSTLNREKYRKQINIGLGFGIGLLIVIPTLFPLLFDKELIYISLIGAVLGFLTWLLRKKMEVLFLIFNGISCGMMLIMLVSVVFGN